MLESGRGLPAGKGHPLETDGQLAAFLHGVQGIGAQVHEHLVKLGGVGQHASLGGGQPRHDLDGGREGGAQHLDHLADNALRPERLDALLGVVAEVEDLAHQVAGAQAGLLDLVQVAPHRRVGVADGGQGHGRVTEDHREDVVEVVGYAAGEQADHLHLLHLAELVRGLATGNGAAAGFGTVDQGGRRGTVRARAAVEYQPGDPRCIRARVDKVAPFAHRPCTAVGVQRAVVDLVGAALGRGPLHRGQNPRAVVGVDQLGQGAGRRADEFGRGATGERFAAVTDQQQGAVAIHGGAEDHGRQPVEEGAQLPGGSILVRLEPLAVVRGTGLGGCR